MAIVAGGYGLPEQGSLVAYGLGLSEPAAPTDDMTAALTGAGTITATLTDGATVTPPSTGGGINKPRRRGPVIQPMPMVAPLPRTPEPVRIVGHMEAVLTGAGSLTATPTWFDWIAYEDEELLLLLDVMA